MAFTSRTARRDPPIASSDQFSQLVNAEFMLRAVTKDGMFLKYASNPMKRNRVVVLRAIENNVEAFYSVLPDKLRRS